MRAQGRPVQDIISVFDLDRTLTRRATYSSFLFFAACKLSPLRLLLLPAVLAIMIGYGLKLISRKRLKELMFSLMLGRKILKGRLEPVVAAFAATTHAHNVPAAACAQLAEERGHGRRILIASASHLFYLEAIAARLGVDEVIGTASVWDGEWLTSRIRGENCYGLAKLTILKDYFEQQGIERDSCHIRFYSDHLSDRACFEWADEPIAVNPSSALDRVARKRGWPILKFR